MSERNSWLWEHFQRLPKPTAEMFGNFPLATAAESEPQDEVKPEELVRWFVEHGWRSSWQDVVARFLKTYQVVRRD